MTSNEVLYRMSVAGSFAGFLSWAVRERIPVLLRAVRPDLPIEECAMIAARLDFVVIGALICVFCVGFGSRWWGSRTRLRTAVDIFLALILGAVTGVIDGALLDWARNGWEEATPHWLLVAAAWGLLGGSTGFLVGFLRSHFRPLRRLAVSTAGGILGGLIGGSVAFAGEWAPYAFQALGLMVAGCFMAFSSTRAVRALGRAWLRLESGPLEVEAYFQRKVASWDLVRGDSYLFGSGSAPPERAQYVLIPDDAMADLHAWIRSSGEDFRVLPHSHNEDGAGFPQQELTVERGADVKEPNGKIGGQVLEPGDVVRMGNTRFRFLTKVALGLALFALASARANASDGGLRLEPVDRGTLCEFGEGSEKPALRVALNVRDEKGLPAKVPTLDPHAVRVYEKSNRLTVLPDTGAKLERYVIILLDVSGSMLEKTSNAPGARTKFDGAIAASRAFAADFADGIDHVAMAPFGSVSVAAGVDAAAWQDRSQQLDAAISDMPRPSPSANTGLYTALSTAARRLGALKRKAATLAGVDQRFLIICLTDGRNDVKRGRDDRDLLTSPSPVVDELAAVGIPVITVGLGSPDNLDEGVLRKLAFPGESNYLPARDTNELQRAFLNARALQLEQINVTFLMKERYRAQLVQHHDYSVQLDTVRGGIHGAISWVPSGAFGDQFGCRIPVPQAVESPLWIYTTVVLGGILLHLVLWFWAPRRIWRDEYDLRILKARALNAIGGGAEGR